MSGFAGKLRQLEDRYADSNGDSGRSPDHWPSGIPPVERALSRPGQIEEAARLLVDAQFPRTVATDMLIAVGLEPDQVFASGISFPPDSEKQRRSSSWRLAILEPWDRQCAFCGIDLQLGSSSVGLEAAHIRWFNLSSGIADGLTADDRIPRGQRGGRLSTHLGSNRGTPATPATK